MARLGMLYAITDEELQQLKSQKQEEIYDYLLESIEEELFGTDRAFELDKAWYGQQYAIGKGIWNEENIVPYNIIFSGEVIFDNEEEFISLKDREQVKKINEFLEQNDLEKIIKDNFEKIPTEEFNVLLDENFLNYLIDWSKGLDKFYKNAYSKNLNVIFSVDF